MKEKLIGQPILLKEVLRDITFSLNRAISDDIHQIDLDKLGEWADELILESLQDSNGYERARNIYVTSEGKVLISNRTYVGRNSFHGKEVETPNESIKDQYGIWKKKLASSLHSHGGVDIPQSPQDILALLLKNVDINSQTCSFVVTTSRKILVFRTSKTPQLSPEEATTLCQKWTQEISDKARSSIAFSSRGAINLQRHIQQEIFDRYIDHLNLALFVSYEDEQIVKRYKNFSESEKNINMPLQVIKEGISVLSRMLNNRRAT